MKILFRVLLAVSFVFVAIALYRTQWLTLPAVRSISHLIVSFPALYASLLLAALAWARVAAVASGKTALSPGLAGFGLSIFGKYVPGKVWVVVGRAAYAAGATGADGERMILSSLHAQLLSLWAALTLGALGMLLHPLGTIAAVSGLLCWTGLTAVLFTRFGAALAGRAARLVLRRRVVVTSLAPRDVAHAVVLLLAAWTVRSLAFWLLIAAVVNPEIPPSVALVLPLAVAAGIVALVAPGGIGVREAVVAFGLAGYGVSMVEAASIAIVSRIWYTGGEVLMFLTGWAIHYRTRGSRDAGGRRSVREGDEIPGRGPDQ